MRLATSFSFIVALCAVFFSPVAKAAPNPKASCSQINCGTLPCCDNSIAGIGQCYTSNYVCAKDNTGITVLCPSTDGACNGRCFNKSQYRCCSFGIEPIGASPVCRGDAQVTTDGPHSSTRPALTSTTSVTYPTIGAQCKGAILTPSNPTTFWVGSIKHKGIAPYNPNPSSYPVYRNVKDFGAKGDGKTDDTAAINAAIVAGGRCGQGCDSTTTQPALVYVPQGTYLISSPIIQYYLTQLVGDAVNLPVLKATPGFSGMAVIDSNPYAAGGVNWYTNQNNFVRQIRNFIIDTTAVNPTTSATGIHWQVAQATSLTNILFRMSAAPGTRHQGIWMENGSGGFMSDLVFEGGAFGMHAGNQQFTSRNLTFTNCDTAVYMNWNWGWTFKNVAVRNCKVGLDLTSGTERNQGQVGSIVFMDSSITDTPVGLLTNANATQGIKTAGSLILDHVTLKNVGKAVATSAGVALLNGGSTVINSWGQGQLYADATSAGTYTEGPLPQTPTKAPVLLDRQGNFFTRARPQYEEYAPEDFVNVKDHGAKGDGMTDDTAAVQAVISGYAGCKIVYFPAGQYLLSSTVTVPPGSRLTGEVWSVIMATGKAFQDPRKPVPMLKVGNVGDEGIVEITDIIFTVHGPAPGALLVQWNIHDPPNQQGAAGMWDTHYRVGGAEGTLLSESQCTKGNPTATPECMAAWGLLHITDEASAYLENVWAWVADHDFDNNHRQISIYNGRGILSTSKTGPVWMVGTAAEHSVLYQYQLSGAKNHYLTMIQTETPYYQGAPPAPGPFPTLPEYADPTFDNCPENDPSCRMSWGLRVLNSENVYIYGAGLYSFFQNYNQECLKTESCQDAMVSFEGKNKNVVVYNLNTKASVRQLEMNGSAILQENNRNGFCSTVMAFLGAL
ncbi:exo-beta-1,3-glucanase [Powellomyces hirtus]|nr:exo-beta-1,3-glucanase [Powellomyces hirtus]